MAKPLLRTDNEVAEIYGRQVGTVYRVCFTYMKNAADTEDATTDTFIKMIKYAPAFESTEHEKAWLIRTAINVCKDSMKNWWRKRENIEDHAEALRVCDTFESDDVTDAVLRLPDKYKAVVCLYYFEGYTSVQISKMLKKPPSTIRNHIHEARCILRERLGEFDEN